jgi:hypothetical protein
VRSRLPLGAMLAAILLASCGGRPGLTVSIGTETVPMVVGSTTEGTACSTSHGDGPSPNVPLTTVRGAAPLTINFEAGQGATEIRGWLYDVDAQSRPTGVPIEEFKLSGRSGAFEPRSLLASRTYSITVNVVWSFVVTHGEETHLFRLRIEP